MKILQITLALIILYLLLRRASTYSSVFDNVIKQSTRGITALENSL